MISALVWRHLGLHYWGGVLRWGPLEVSGGLGFSLSLNLFDDPPHYSLHIRFLWPNIFLRLPFRARREPSDTMESWGFRIFLRDTHLNWGARTKIVHHPWDWVHVLHEVQREDGSWVSPRAEYSPPYSDGRAVGEFFYSYRLKSGEYQNRVATVYCERREWRWRWLMWAAWPRRRSQCISVNFDDEVGERTGSWKGGCLGCGYEMLPGETAEQTLRRMERDRKF